MSVVEFSIIFYEYIFLASWKILYMYYFVDNNERLKVSINPLDISYK